MPNLQHIITSHNNKLLKIKDNNEPSSEKCNCRKKHECPLNNECLTDKIVYEAIIKQPNGQDLNYIGLTEGTFKARFTEHKSNFRNIKKRHATRLSEKIWELNDNKANFSIDWKIIEKAEAYSPKTKSCKLCLTEKYHIITSKKTGLLNQRAELASTCRHRRKHLLRHQYRNFDHTGCTDPHP